MMGWSVVHFLLDNTVEVVPCQWIKKDGRCAWPKTSKTKDIKKSVYNKVRPNSNEFNFYEARCLANNIDNYLNAQKKCELAKSKSDISSAEDYRTKRKKLKKQPKMSSSESDCEYSDDSDSADNSIPCYLSDSKSNSKKYSNSQSQNITRKPGWSPSKTSVIDYGENIICEKNGSTSAINIFHKSTVPINEENTSPLKSGVRDILMNDSKSNSKKYSNSQSQNITRKPGWSPSKTSVIDYGENIICEKNGSTSAINIFHKSTVPINEENTSPLKSGVRDILMNENKLQYKPISKHTENKSTTLGSKGAKRNLFSDSDNIKTPTLNTNGKSSDYLAFKSTPQSHSSSTITTVQKDKDFQNTILRQLLSMKYDIRSMDEKINILLKLSEDNKVSSTCSDNMQDYSIDIELPITTIQQLNDFEIKICDKSFRARVIKLFSSVGGKSVKMMVKRIMSMLFMPEVLSQFSYNGRGNKKLSFAALQINKVIFESVRKINKFDNSINEIEDVIKYKLIQAPFTLKRKGSMDSVINEAINMDSPQ